MKISQSIITSVKTIDELIEYCRGLNDVQHTDQFLSDRYACSYALRMFSEKMISILKSKTNTPSRFDLMLINLIGIFKHRRENDHQKILELYIKRDITP